MLSLSVVEMYNNAARSWNNLKRGSQLPGALVDQTVVEEVLKSIEIDIIDFLKKAANDTFGLTDKVCRLLDDKTKETLSFLVIKDNQFIFDTFFGPDRRYLCGTFKNGLEHRYEGPWFCCGRCAERIYKGVLVRRGCDVVDPNGLELDLEDYSEVIDTENEKDYMLCWFCALRLPEKSK